MIPQSISKVAVTREVILKMYLDIYNINSSFLNFFLFFVFFVSAAASRRYKEFSVFGANILTKNLIYNASNLAEMSQFLSRLS